MKEVEVKYSVKNFKNIKHLLKRFGFKKAKTKEYEDYYYTDKDWKFIRNETCLRLRRYKDKTVLTYKPRTVKNVAIKSKTEVETIVDFKSMHKVLIGLGYVLAVNFNKRSDEYKKGKLTVSLDIVGKKRYVEVEVLAYNTKLAKERIKRIVQELDLKHVEMRNYRDLMIGYNRYAKKS